jgi:hypothetical protein
MPPVRIALTVCALFLLAVGGATASAGSFAAVKQCQKNGWQTLYTRAGAPFANQKACTSYANHGGVLLPQAALICLNAGWVSLGPNSNTLFANEQACVDDVRAGGTPVPAGADLSLSIAGAGDINSIDDICNPGWRINVTNNGPVDAFVVVEIAVDNYFAATGANPGWSIPERITATDTSLTLRTSRTITAGTTAWLEASTCGTTGSVSVFSSGAQDPDSTPGNGFVAGEDDGVEISGSGPT